MIIIDLFYDIADFITDFIGSGTAGKIFITIKITSIVISVLLFIGSVVLIFKLGAIRRLAAMIESFTPPELPKSKIIKQWQQILAKMESGSESDWKLAVIEADKMLDDILVKIGIRGDTMGDRLKRINPAQLSNLNNIWQAHRIRNAIAHDAYYKMTRSDAERAIKAYERALEELEAI